MSDVGSEPSPQAGGAESGPSEPPPAPAPAASAPPAEAGTQPNDPRLIALCIVLVLAAVGLFWSSWDDMKKNYYWGNIRQALDPANPGGARFDRDSIKALAAMGEAIIPSCKESLERPRDPLFQVGVLKVLEEVPGAKSHALLESVARTHESPQVRANALLTLRSRAKNVPDEAKALVAIAGGVFKDEADPDLGARNHVKATAALVLAENGDTRKELLPYLVFDLRLFAFGETAALLEKVEPAGPKLNVEAKKPEEVRGEVMKYEKWCQEHGVALVTSAIAPKAEKKDEPPK